MSLAGGSATISSTDTRAIIAVFVQKSEHLSGSLRDGVTDNESSVTEVAIEAGLPPGGDEQIVDRLRRMFPTASSGSGGLLKTVRGV